MRAAARPPLRAALAVLLGALLAGAATAASAAQEAADWRRIEATVTAVTGGNVYLDVGRGQGVEPGDRVFLFPPGRPRGEATVLFVSRTSSRAEVVSGLDDLAVGVSAEVLVPAPRLDRPEPAGAPPTDPAGAETQRPVRDRPPPPAKPPAGAGSDPGATEPPEHPPWTQPPEAWSTDLPLLAPLQGTEPADREKRFFGRTFVAVDHTWDDEGGERRYLLARAGVDATWENPFERGGGIQLDVEYFQRSASFGDAPDEDDGRGRIDRLSYFMGGTRGAPGRFEVGRFLPIEFPELGVIDGFEAVWRREGGDRWGGNVGYLPRPDATFGTAEDFGAAGFYRWVFGEDEELSTGVAVQKTWNEGTPDRDLVIGTVDYFPSSAFSLSGSAWLDYYTSSDTIKSQGFELTELHLAANGRFDTDTGAGVQVSRIRWPELLRREFAALPPAQVADSEVTRVSANAWRRLGRDVRVSARVHRWEDEEDDGGGGEARISLRDILYDEGEVTLAAYTNDGSFGDVVGARIGASRAWSRGFGTASWETAVHERAAAFGGQQDLLQHVLRLSWDADLGDGWTLAVQADERFGDDQDSRTLGFVLQRRF